MAVVCLGPYWYEVAAKAPPWWTMTRGRSELSLAYFGTADRLRRQTEAILSGQEVTITVIRHSTHNQTSFGAVAFKHLLRGGHVPIGCMKASLSMPATILESTRDQSASAGSGDLSEQERASFARALRSPDARVRAEAAEELQLVGPQARALAPALSAALSDSNGLVRVRAAGALARVSPEDPAALPVVLRALQDADPEVRKAAAETLGDIGPDADTSVPALISALKDPEAGVRWAAAEALGQGGPESEPGVPALAQALRDPAIRAIAADALGEIGPCAENAVPALVDLLQDGDRNLRWMAALALCALMRPQRRRRRRFSWKRSRAPTPAPAGTRSGTCKSCRRWNKTFPVCCSLQKTRAPAYERQSSRRWGTSGRRPRA